MVNHQDDEDDYGRGQRERNTVLYDDDLTEAQFLKAIEGGNLDEASRCQVSPPEKDVHYSSVVDNASLSFVSCANKARRVCAGGGVVARL